MSSCCCCFCVSTASLGVVENCGKYSHMAEPGCSMLIPCVGSLRGVVHLGVQQARVVIDTKTKDNAVVTVEAHIYYRVAEDKAMESFYRFSNPAEQIGSFAASIVRGEMPKYTLDEIFLLSDEIKRVVAEELSEKLHQYGFLLESTLIPRISPSTAVKSAISQTQVNHYKRTAAEHQAELDKLLTIKEAEADFEEKRLSGVGLAEERKAILKGLQSSIEDFVEHVPGMSARDVMNLLLLNQYFDAMKEIGSGGNNRMIMLPGGHDAMAEMLSAQASAMLAINK